jgi:hypothetical protein
MKTKRPDEDWEKMQADSDIVEPNRNYVTGSTAMVGQEREVENECERPERQ